MESALGKEAGADGPASLGVGVADAGGGDVADLRIREGVEHFF